MQHFELGLKDGTLLLNNCATVLGGRLSVWIPTLPRSQSTTLKLAI